MGLYLWSLLLGVVGLGAMAVSGLSHGHGDGHGGHGGHGHGGHGHGGHGHGNGGHAHPGHHGHDGSHASTGQHEAHGASGRSLWALMSPRYLFSLALGFGATGELVRPLLGGPALLLVAVLGAIAFE